MKTSSVIATWTLVALIVGALTVSACYRSHTPAERADWMANKISKELALDGQQKVTLDAVKQEYLKAHAEMRQQHEAMLDEVMAQLPADRLDQAKLLQLFEQHQASMNRFAPSMLDRVSELHATLTPQQKSKAVEQLTRLREHMRAHDGQGKM